RTLLKFRRQCDALLGKLMRIFTLVAAAAAFFALGAGPASAAWTQAGIACVKAQGYQPADWEAYRVPRAPADKIRACMARAKAKGLNEEDRNRTRRADYGRFEHSNG